MDNLGSKGRGGDAGRREKKGGGDRKKFNYRIYEYSGG